VSVLTRKILPSFFGIATVGWIIGGTIWFDKQLSKNTTNVFSPNFTSSSSIVVQNNVLPRNICFNLGSAVPIYFNDHIIDLHNTADYLVRNNHQSLVLTGLSDNREMAADHLGFARAEAVKTTLSSFGAPNNSLEIRGEKGTGVIVANNQICDAVKMVFSTASDAHFQGLNLFFKEQKYRFSETLELQTYFNDLQYFLAKNPTAQLKIAAYGSNTDLSSGSHEERKISEKRLAFMRQYLKEKKFNMSQLNFDKSKANQALIAVADRQNLTNQRIEIRILTP
jgi:outer membrane protein OmpA-like peptidoglycan-associated protein